jgi:hypothetical protein
MLQGIPQSVKAFREWREPKSRIGSQGSFVWFRETQVPSVRNPGEGSLRFGWPPLQIEIQSNTTIGTRRLAIYQTVLHSLRRIFRLAANWFSFVADDP